MIKMQSKAAIKKREPFVRRSWLAYRMIAERDNEKVQSRQIGVFLAVAKARVWASEGWRVVVTDGDGRSFSPAEFDGLCAFGTSKMQTANDI